MATLILDKTVTFLSEIIAAMQLQLEEDKSSFAAMAESSYYDNEYNNSVENHYSRYGF
jgi:hypothetical protein